MYLWPYKLHRREYRRLTAGTGYPILNPPGGEAQAVNNDFNINYFPTLYGVAPNGTIYEVGQGSVSDWESWLLESFQMVFSTAEIEDTDCEFSAIDLNVVGGFINVDYEWSNGETTEDITDLENGTYYVTITDYHDFEFELGPLEVDNSNLGEIELIDALDLLCNNDYTGYIEIEMDGGSGNFEYEWSNGADSPVLDNIEFGSYEVTVTDDNSGCEFEAEYYLEEPDPIEVNYELENANCDGSSNGAVDFIVDGGTYPFTFEFHDFETQDDYITLEPGYYDVTITDGNGCMDYVDFSILADDAPLALAESTGNFNCVTDTVYVHADSSSIGNNITYNWFDPTNVFVGSGYQVQVDSAGIYTLEVYDEDSECSSFANIVVMQDMNIPVAVANPMNDIDCTNTTSVITGNGSSADSLTTYTWSTLDVEILTDPNVIDVTVGTPGTYELLVSNIQSGCVSMATAVVEESGNPIIDLTGDLEFCGGSNTTLCVTEEVDESIEWFINGESVGNTNCLTVDQGDDITITLTNVTNGCSSNESVQTIELDQPVIDLSGDLEFCSSSASTLCVKLILPRLLNG